MECPRCGGDMSSGVCENCGFPIISVKLRKTEKNRGNKDERRK